MDIHIHIKTLHHWQLLYILNWCEEIGERNEIDEISVSTDGYMQFKPEEEVSE